MRRYRFVSLLIALSSVSTLALAAPTTGQATKNANISKTPVSKPKNASHEAASQNMWTVIASNFSLPHYADTPAVQRQIEWFQTHQKYFLKVANQGQPYMYYIYESVKKRGLPGELVLLPMIESAYDPFAYSWVGAAGLWQMMPATGSNFGLKQDWWYDGRKDIISSTDAALDYLTYLETFFNGNWPLAIAAYNSGEGTVQNAIDRNAHRGRGTTFWELDLPAETESYVPRLLALAAIVSNPAKYGVDLPPIHNGPYFSMVSLKQQIDLSQAAKMADISLSTLYELNPGYNRWATDPKGPYRLLLPIDAVSLFEARYAEQFGPHNIVSETSPSHATTKAILVNTNKNNSSVNSVEQAMVKGSTPNPTLNSIEVNQGTTTTKPATVNPNTSTINGSTSKSNGSTSKSTVSATPTSPTSTVKPTTAPASSQPPTPVVTPPTPSAPTTITYTVKAGDNLWSIAKHFNVTVGQLRTWNKLSERTRVQVGEKLIIKLPPKQQSSNQYIVKPGDTLFSIARNHGLHLDQIEAMNPQLTNDSELAAGTIVNLS